jgi:uncharacterized protein YfaQ (DUF2300 family)
MPQLTAAVVTITLVTVTPICQAALRSADTEISGQIPRKKYNARFSFITALKKISTIVLSWHRV